jgi:hypothetical protein
LREVVLGYVSRVSGGALYIPALLQFIRDPAVVDDASALMLAYRLVDMRAAKIFKERKEISETAIWMLKSERRDSWAYAALWLLSKYGTGSQIMSAVDATYSIWQSDYYLGRLVASLECMIPPKHQARFADLVRVSRNLGASEVSAFYADLLNDPKVAAGLKKFLRAPNKNANKISHPKWIVLMQVLNSPAVPIVMKRELKTVHAMAFSDRYYRARAKAYLKI